MQALRLGPGRPRKDLGLTDEQVTWVLSAATLRRRSDYLSLIGLNNLTSVTTEEEEGEGVLFSLLMITGRSTEAVESRCRRSAQD